jgi:hypothetical protein
VEWVARVRLGVSDGELLPVRNQTHGGVFDGGGTEYETGSKGGYCSNADGGGQSEDSRGSVIYSTLSRSASSKAVLAMWVAIRSALSRCFLTRHHSFFHLWASRSSTSQWRHRLNGQASGKRIGHLAQVRAFLGAVSLGMSGA